MRRNTRALVQFASSMFDLPQPVVEFGAYQVTGAPGEDLRAFFPGREFIGCDIRPGPGVDRVQNLEALGFGDATVGTAILLDTLEHVQDPIRAMQEVYRVLRPGGICIATSVMDLFIHCEPDYWRFTPAAFNHLFREFSETLTGWQGNREKPHTVFSVGIKAPARSFAPEFAALEHAYRRATRTWYWRIAQPYYVARDALRMVQHNNDAAFELTRKAA